MIVRILGEGRFDIPATALPCVDRLHRQLVEAVTSADERSFERLLPSLLSAVRLRGVPLGVDHLGTVDMLLPAKDDTIGDVRTLLRIVTELHAGLISG